MARLWRRSTANLPVGSYELHAVSGCVTYLHGRRIGRKWWVSARAFEEAGGRIVGAVTLTGITRGPFCSAYLGYWAAADRQGRGLASAAVSRVCGLARDVVGHIDGRWRDSRLFQRILHDEDPAPWNAPERD
ncbi:GNAT family N-acetyltransferase [Streptomyces sp. SID6139]|uniref:GNAT family N-acetyltransferase n=1 Tax=Streptomyces sp. SID6139 TaxID=2690320 RepID=UPI0031FBD760